MQKRISIRAVLISILLVANSAWLLVLALTFLYALAEELFSLPGAFSGSVPGGLTGIFSALLIVYVLWLAVLALLGLSALVENKANALRWRYIWPAAGGGGGAGFPAADAVVSGCLYARGTLGACCALRPWRSGYVVHGGALLSLVLPSLISSRMREAHVFTFHTSAPREFSRWDRVFVSQLLLCGRV